MQCCASFIHSTFIGRPLCAKHGARNSMVNKALPLSASIPHPWGGDRRKSGIRRRDIRHDKSVTTGVRVVWLGSMKEHGIILLWPEMRVKEQRLPIKTPRLWRGIGFLFEWMQFKVTEGYYTGEWLAHICAFEDIRGRNVGGEEQPASNCGPDVWQ